MKNKTMKLQKWYFLFIGLVGVVLALVIPPFQKNDEVSHFYRTAALVDGGWLCKNGNFSVRDSYFNMPYRFDIENVLILKDKFPKSLFGQNLTGIKKTNSFQTVSNICNLNFVGYFPNTLGLAIGQLFKSPLIMFELGRIFGLLFFMGCIYWVLKNINPKYRYIVMFYASLPMVLHQVTAYSYDVTILSLVPMGFLFVTKFMETRSKSWLIKSTVVFLIISLIKPVYFPLVIICPVLNFWEGKNKIKEIFMGALLFGVSAALVYGSIKLFADNTSNTLYSGFSNPYVQIKMVLDDPMFGVMAVINSLINQGEAYYRSSIGIFGWMDAPIASALIYYIVPVLFVFVVYQLSKIEKSKVSLVNLIVLFGGIIGVVLLTMVSMFLINTDIGSSVIVGVQGRYFFPILPFLMLFIANLIAYLRQHKITWFFPVILGIYILYSVTLGLYNRYYNYSSNFANFNQLTDTISSKTKKVKDSYEVVDKKIRIVADVPQPNYKVAGFRLDIDSLNKRILVPYKYTIKDQNCERVYSYGYLNQSQIQKPSIYTGQFSSIKVIGNSLCFELEPLLFGANYKDSFLSIKVADGKELFTWLYLKK